MSGTDESEKFVLSPETIDMYFKVKIPEARESGRESWLRLMEASQVLWDEKRKMHRSVSMEILRWSEETKQLEALMDIDYARSAGARKTSARKSGARFALLIGFSCLGFTFSQVVEQNMTGATVGACAYGGAISWYALDARRRA